VPPDGDLRRRLPHSQRLGRAYRETDEAKADEMTVVTEDIAQAV
jgi:hypothetical protein